MNVSEKVALQDDNTFTIQHGGATLLFKLDQEKRSVTLVSAAEPAASPYLLQPVSSPKMITDEGILKKLSQANALFFPDIFSDHKDFVDALVPLQKFSKDMVKLSGTKPVVVLRFADKGGAGVNIDKAMRTISDKKFALDAHIFSIPGMKKI